MSGIVDHAADGGAQQLLIQVGVNGPDILMALSQVLAKLRRAWDIKVNFDMS